MSIVAGGVLSKTSFPRSPASCPLLGIYSASWVRSLGTWLQFCEAVQKLLRGSSTSRHPTFGDIATGVFTPVLAKHSKSFSLVDCISVSVDRMQRNFEPMRKQVETWQQSELTDVTAKVVISEAFVEGRLEAPKHLARTVHDFTSKGSTRSSSQGQSGVSRMHLLPYPRNWTRFRSSRRQRSWANTSKPGSQNRSRQDCSVAMNQGLF